MGREVVRAVAQTPDMRLVGAVARSHLGADIGEVLGLGALGVAISDDLAGQLLRLSQQSTRGVMVDFTQLGKAFNPPEVEERELIPGSRGGIPGPNIPIHSVRLPGLVAHQEVIFGGMGQTLTLRHDITDRVAFMPGVILGIRKVLQLKGLVYGLEQVLS
jgi:dihydrodipicolinate reductase